CCSHGVFECDAVLVPNFAKTAHTPMGVGGRLFLVVLIFIIKSVMTMKRKNKPSLPVRHGLHPPPPQSRRTITRCSCVVLTIEFAGTTPRHTVPGQIMEPPPI